MSPHKFKPLENNIISHPAHYIEGRMIEPIFIIEEYGLCHHLACVVKYIARAGRKTSIINDLRKAEWYLDRELQRCRAGAEACSPPLSKIPEFKTDTICEDWKLSPHLKEVLSCILDDRLAAASCKTFQWTRAMEHLRLAISEYEQGAPDEQ